MIDISVGAVNSGLLACALQAIRISLSTLAEKGNHTRVGLAMVDVRTHFLQVQGERLSEVMMADYEEGFGAISAGRWLVEVNEQSVPKVGS